MGRGTRQRPRRSGRRCLSRAGCRALEASGSILGNSSQLTRACELRFPHAFRTSAMDGAFCCRAPDCLSSTPRRAVLGCRGPCSRRIEAGWPVDYVQHMLGHGECQIFCVWGSLIDDACGRCGKPRSVRFSKARWARSVRPRGRQRPCARSFYAFGARKRSS
jgi:hypothetical protein